MINNKPIKDMTIEDALQAFEMGLCCVCADGKVKCFCKERIE
jgi:hypothetical protein